jgi:hypothetical protein
MKNGEPMFTLLLVIINSLVAISYGGWVVQVTSPKNMGATIHNPIRCGTSEFARS